MLSKAFERSSRIRIEMSSASMASKRASVKAMLIVSVEQYLAISALVAG